MRITIPDFMDKVEEQTEGVITKDDFFPVPTVVPISRAVAALKDKEYVEFTAHPHCGMATYVFIEGDKMVPINRYVNVNKFISTMDKIYAEAKKRQHQKSQSTPTVATTTHQIRITQKISTTHRQKRKLRLTRRIAQKNAADFFHALYGPIQL